MFYEEHIEPIISFTLSSVTLVGLVVTVLGIISFLALVIASIKGVVRPLWRLGLGLSQRQVLIAASQDDYDSIKHLLEKCNLFVKTVMPRYNGSDMELIQNADVIVYRYEDIETLKEILSRRAKNTPLIVYAKNKEIEDEEAWVMLDKYTNTTVCNLKGRLINDVLVGLMTNAYVK